MFPAAMAMCWLGTQLDSTLGYTAFGTLFLAVSCWWVNDRRRRVLGYGMCTVIYLSLVVGLREHT